MSSVQLHQMLLGYNRTFRLRNNDGRRDIFWRLFRTRSVMGRLCAGNNTWKWEEPQPGADRPPVYFRCPKCTHVEQIACKAFQTHDLDRKQKCNACGVLSPVSLWKCSCQDFWHHCGTHHRSAYRQQSPHIKREPKGRTVTTFNPQENDKRTRTVGPTSYEELLEEDLRRAKRKRDEEEEWKHEPCIFLGKPHIKSIRVSSLGPI